MRNKVYVEHKNWKNVNVGLEGKAEEEVTGTARCTNMLSKVVM